MQNDQTSNYSTKDCLVRVGTFSLCIFYQLSNQESALVVSHRDEVEEYTSDGWDSAELQRSANSDSGQIDRYRYCDYTFWQCAPMGLLSSIVTFVTGST